MMGIGCCTLGKARQHAVFVSVYNLFMVYKLFAASSFHALQSVHSGDSTT